MRECLLDLQVWLQSKVDDHPWLQHLQQKYGVPSSEAVAAAQQIGSNFSEPAQVKQPSFDDWSSGEQDPDVDTSLLKSIRGTLLFLRMFVVCRPDFDVARHSACCLHEHQPILVTSSLSLYSFASCSPAVQTVRQECCHICCMDHTTLPPCALQSEYMAIEHGQSCLVMLAA